MQTPNEKQSISDSLSHRFGMSIQDESAEVQGTSMNLHTGDLTVAVIAPSGFITSALSAAWLKQLQGITNPTLEPDTIFTPMQTAWLIRDFGSRYLLVLTMMQQQITRAQADTCMKKGAEPLQVKLWDGRTAFLKIDGGSVHNPTTDVKEYGVKYLRVEPAS